MSQRKYNTSEVLKNIFRVSFDAEDGSQPKPFNVVKYFVLPLVFAAALAVLFYCNLQKLNDLGGDVSNAMEAMFTLLLSLVFAIIGVYLVIHVLHPYFGKRPVPAKLEKIIDEETDSDMTREEIHEFLEDLRLNDEEIREYSDSIDVKTEIAVTLGLALVAFFLGIYGYIASFTIMYDDAPNILGISFCFMFIIFSIIYIVLKTMKVVWDV